MRLAGRRDADDDRLAERLGRRFELDLVGLLNACRKDELAALARAIGVRADADAPALRRALWRWGAVREAGGTAYLGSRLQPEPVVLGGRLVHQAPPRGLWPPAAVLPRPLPPPAPAAPPAEEPETVEDLLAAADRVVGVRLGPRGSDKGAWGTRAAWLLGVAERGEDEPDWRGDVEIKTVPVVRDASGLWRVVEDPAVGMATPDEPVRPGPGSPLAKLQRVLWLVRAPTDDGDTTILSWYFLEWDDKIGRLVGRYLHQRPKGPAGTSQRGWYLQKRFFAAAGLLATLNGGAAEDTT